VIHTMKYLGMKDGVYKFWCLICGRYVEDSAEGCKVLVKGDFFAQHFGTVMQHPEMPVDVELGIAQEVSEPNLEPFEDYLGGA